MSASSRKIFLNKLRWFAYEKLTSAGDLILFYLGYPISGSSKIQGDTTIVYVGESLPPRIPRVAKWFKRSGNYTTVLVCHKRGFVEKFSNPDIDYTFLFRNEWHLKRIIRALKNPYILHGFAPKSKFPFIAKEACKKYSPSTPFIIDYQDVFVIYYGKNPSMRWLQNELPYEQGCFRDADGVIANSLEACEAMKVWEVKKPGKRIFFPLYCDNDYFCNTEKKFPAGEIHLVYAGGIYGSHRDKSHYGIAQLHWLIEYLQPQKVHLHIYPSPSSIGADYEEYAAMAKANPYLHLHPSVSQSKLAEELSQYHYGLMPFFSTESNQSDIKLKYATTLKLFNYAEAGIPILVAADVMYQSWLVTRYGLGISVAHKDDFKDVRKLTGNIPYTEQAASVIKNREVLSLKEHIPRLIRFYEKMREKV
jgi:hypothetical protein